MVAIPVYDGKVPIEMVGCLMHEQIAAVMAGLDFQVRFLPSCSHPAMGRNQLAMDFLESDCDKLIFVDSDVTFEGGAIVRLAMLPVDLVAGAYRYKTAVESYPVTWLPNKELWSNGLGLIEVETLPTGFMAISRKVFDTLRDIHSEREYLHQGKVAHCFFQMPFINGHLYGEDSFFCQEWRKAGGKVFLDPMISLTHWDHRTPYAGCIGNWLKNQIPKVTDAKEAQ